MHRCMIGTETVFIIAIIDSNLNRHRCVYQTNDSGRNSDEVCVSAVRGTSESAGAPKKVSASLLPRTTFRKLMGECLDIISGKWQLLPSNISYKASPNDQDGFLFRLVNLTVLGSGIARRNEKYCEYLANDSKLCHRVYNAQKGGNGLRLLADLGLVYLEFKAVVLEVLFDLITVHIVHVQVSDSQHSAPALVALSQLRVLGVEDAIEKGEVVGYLLVAVHVESILGLQDRCSKVRHVEVV